MFRPAEYRLARSVAARGRSATMTRDTRPRCDRNHEPRRCGDIGVVGSRGRIESRCGKYSVSVGYFSPSRSHSRADGEAIALRSRTREVETSDSRSDAGVDVERAPMTSPGARCGKAWGVAAFDRQRPGNGRTGHRPCGRRRVGRRYCVAVGDDSGIGCCCCERSSSCSAAIASWVLKAGATFSWSSL